MHEKGQITNFPPHTYAPIPELPPIIQLPWSKTILVPVPDFGWRPVNGQVSADFFTA